MWVKRVLGSARALAEQFQKNSRRGHREPHARARMFPRKRQSDFAPQNRDENVDYYAAN